METVNKDRSRQNGFTLVELLLYVSIISVTLIVFTNFVFDITKNIAAAKEKREVHQNSRLVLERLTQDIRNASQIVAVQQHAISMLDGAGQPISYNLINNAVVVTTPTSVAPITTPSVDVTNFNFSSTAPSISVTLAIKPHSSNPLAIAETLSSAITPRIALY